MPDTTEDANRPLESSPSESSTSTEEATATAGSQAPDGSPPPDKAVEGEQKPQVAVDEDAPTAQSAIELLSGTPEQKATPKPKEKPAEPPKADPKPEEKKPVDLSKSPLDDYTDAEKQRISHKTRDRIETLHTNWKQTEAKLKEQQPFADEGKVWATIMDKYKVRSDLADIQDDSSVAEAIKFQACLHRIAGGRASQQDAQFVNAVYDTLDATRQQLGLPSKSTAPDTAEIEKAIAKAKTEFDFTDLENLVAKAKSPQPVQRTQEVVAPPPQQEQQPTGPSEDEIYYARKLESELTDSGIESAKVREYVGDKLWPMVVDRLGKMYPGTNPVQMYARLKDDAKFDAVMTAHRVYQKQQAALATKKSETSANPARPVRTTGTQKLAAQEPPVGNGLAAARWLAGG